MSVDATSNSPSDDVASLSPADRTENWPVIVPGLPSEDREAQILWRVRYGVSRTHLRQLLVNARLRTFLVVVLSI
ncbi:MAG TPA: hypothetical protein VHU84_06055, partial [Lacipirellulaceae bacterium]|nr:hypothetical protein [Lacipirellulaceae bacterium]